ncbi:MAG: hypothetical protein IT338_13665 [Thermomicrobiales bacterium]|nr:hypothetical protein [Thermomicrobiales bacterium]
MKHERIASPNLPGGDLVSALFDREIMGLADRGGASNLVGDRWADIAAAHVAAWVGSERPLHASDGQSLAITRVDRLDATPGIAAAASRRGLQNPDLLLIGRAGDRQTIQAADAKFSVETARAKQVSPRVVLDLLALRGQVPELLPGLNDDLEAVPGIFLCPDYPLTHLMLKRRHGIVRTTVRGDEVVFVPAPPDHFWHGVEGASIMAPLAEVDDLPVRPAQSLLAGVYYFRLARAAVGFWLDATKPLLLYNDTVTVDEAAIRDEAERRSRAAESALGLIRQWDADVQTIRNQRAAVDQVAALPIPGREMRARVQTIAEASGAEPPSANQVRKRLGAWYRGELRARVGPIAPPVADLSSVLQQVAAAGREVAPRVDAELERVVQALIAEADARDRGPIVDEAPAG